MKVFITGGTGYLGTVLVEHLVKAGHDVAGLARSDAGATRLHEAGATPVAGSLSDTAVLEGAAAAADAVVHAAVDYAMTDESAAVELAAVKALVAGAASGTVPKPFIFTSTALVYGFEDDRDTSEDAVLPEVSAQPVKVAAERIVRGEAGISGIVFRAGLVFGRGGSPVVTGLIQSAQHTGTSIYVGHGENAWTPVHVDDLADLYVAAIERPVSGVYNVAGTVPFTFRALAGAIGDLTGKPVASVPLEVAEQNFGPAARILTTTSRLDAAKARDTFGWSPAPRSLIDDVRSGSYAEAAAK
ncbi:MULTISPECIES: NAD-dependent epimerase/dehydratase family protein [Amycolatopsis]|uniref:Nucleoside-diphosphate-sugar epimerase n=2 Tax=Amycolatopsis TaxID=1813 RepID=A0A1I4D4C4_9PSEU|nr:NAD-dependent epimerase/dehydratase family protein [Amycolatopsis sacchari]SFK87629.1 Nucleoside-diphosphate-sugar epimerase [Amycolatopsis sacchari]